MARETIDYGIDLGTTNSCIAVVKGTETEVIPNKFGSQRTPCAVYIDKKGQLHVGQDAKAMVAVDPDNAKAEFKLLMGQGERGRKQFTRSGRTMLPEEMSAKILKSLRADIHEKKGEDIEAIVITVPAAFEVDQCEATRRAAEMAGFKQCVLLQEPVAVALAYGIQARSDNVFWMVYDFRGGTFDATIIHVRDGFVNVVNHAGDNFLGGQRIDWEIVEKRFIPKLTGRYHLKDFGRGNPERRAAMAKLKGVAEEAKIEVCRKKSSASVWIEDLCKDDSGKTVDFEYELKPEELEQIVSPFTIQSINLCKKAMEEKGLSGANIEKILMVGGTSLIPWLRDRVKKELGIDLEFSIDPMTVIARGAAIFAGTQQIDPNKIPPYKIPAGLCSRPGRFIVRSQRNREYREDIDKNN